MNKKMWGTMAVLVLAMGYLMGVSNTSNAEELKPMTLS